MVERSMASLKTKR